ncbi:MAG TPA: deoxyribonuclease IV [Verrucomicrobiae bacterium]
MKFGAHMSTAGGPWKALQRGRSIGCDSIQIFVKNNMQWFGKPPSAAEVALFSREREVSGVSVVFGHTGYLINLGAPPSPNREKSLQSLIQEIEFAAALGLPFLVLHPGAHLGAGERAGFARIVSGLDEVIAATKKSLVRVALEVTAGQGTSLGYRLEHLATIIDSVKRPERLGVCLDTAHLFAAGYDIRRPRVWAAVTKEIAALVGLRQVLAFHLNDSKTELGSRVDRHAHIGQGKIGRNGFRHIVNDVRFKNLPGCLETPKGPDLKEDVENLAVLRALVRRS